MYANLLYIAKVEQARREEAERAAANWRTSRLCSPPQPRKQWVRKLSKRIRLLAQSRHHSIERPTAPKYAAQ